MLIQREYVVMSVIRVFQAERPWFKAWLDTSAQGFEIIDKFG